MPMHALARSAFGAAAVLALMGCSINAPRAANSAADSAGLARDTAVDTIFLREAAPSDSVILKRSGAVVLLSMRDVENFLTAIAYDPGGDWALFLARIRQSFLENGGWVELSEGMLEDLIAAHLIDLGKATIRQEDSSVPLAWLVVSQYEDVFGAAARAGREFFLPDGTLLLRVIDRIVIT